MFSTREFKILTQLRENDYNGDTLARKLQTSRRTIIRDIANINDQLAVDQIGVITSAGVYHLHLNKPEKFNAILVRNTDEKNQILIALCANPVNTLAELGDKFYLSKAAVQSYINQISEAYQGIFSLTSKPGTGLKVRFQRLSATDVLASCLFEHPKMIGQIHDNARIMQVATKLADSLLNPYAQWLTPTQWRLQIFACLICQTAPAAGTMQQFPITTVPGLTVVEQHKLASFLGKRVSDIQKLFGEKQQLLRIYNDLTKRYQLTAISLKTFEDVFAHLIREAAFPHPGVVSMHGELRKLRIKNPIPFDFAQQFTAELMAHHPSQWWDANYLALYVVQAINQRDTKPVRMLLYAPRPSLERINSTILQQHIKNMSLTMIATIEESQALQVTGNFDIAIANISPSMATNDGSHFDFTFSGVVTSDEIQTIEQLVNGRYYQENLTAMLPPSHYVALNAGEDFWSALEVGLKHFVEQNSLTDTEVASVVNREREGNQLILQHISIPHITTDTTEDYKLFAIVPLRPVKLEGTPISLVLVVLAGAAQAERNNIFSYFYQTLRRLNGRLPEGVHDYKDVVQLLGGNFQ